MKIQITLNGVKTSKQIPISWAEVTFRQFIALQECKDDFVKVMSLFTSIEPDIIRKALIDNLDAVILSLGFLQTEPGQIKPTSILGYELPKDLGFESIAQFEDVKDTLKKAKDMTVLDHMNLYPLYCSIYACKPYDWIKAEELSNKFFDAPCQEVLGVGNFTLAKLIGLKLSTGQKSQKRSILPKKFRLALTAWRMHLAFTVRSFFWKKRQGIPEKIF